MFCDVCFVLLQENECLKKEVFEKSSRIEEQNRKIGDLINQNQKWAVFLWYLIVPQCKYYRIFYFK